MPDGGREVAGCLAGRDQDTVDLLEEYPPMARNEPETLIVSHDLDLHPRPEAGSFPQSLWNEKPPEAVQRRRLRSGHVGS